MPFLAAVFLTALIRQEPLPVDKLDAYFKDQLVKRKAPSVAVSIMKDGKIVYAKGFGYADLQNEIPATEHTVYRLGSLTKQFTATMIMQLIKEGKMTLDDPASKHLTKLPKAWAKVTVRQLLNHTSGIKSYTEVPGLMEDLALKSVKPQGIIAVVESQPMDFEPGTKWHYNNTGYEVLGMLIEKFDARPFENSLKARILTPLGMTETYFTSEKTLVKKRAQGYALNKGQIVNCGYINMDWPYAAGSMESTVSDLAKWDAALYTEKLLPKASLDLMWTDSKLKDGKPTGYGFGWGVGKQNNVPEVGHGGGINGFATYIKRVPSKGLTVVVLANTEAVDTGSLATEAMCIVDPTLRPVVPVVEDKEPAKTTAAKSILTDFLAGKMDRTKFTAQMNNIITDDKLKQASSELSKLGPIEKFEFIGEKSAGDQKIRLYRVVFAGAELKLDLGLDAKGVVFTMSLHQ